jgi:hypothetical protein
LYEGAPRQNAAESRKIPESGSVIPREGVESYIVGMSFDPREKKYVIPREGVERLSESQKGEKDPLFAVIPREGVESISSPPS